jgi:ribosomal protein S18 acetylase RimI-like enzyme
MTAQHIQGARRILPYDHQSVTIRWARPEDVDGAKTLADQERTTTGFVNRAVLQEAQQRDWLLVAVHHTAEAGGYVGHVVGFANFRIRQDRICTLYEIAVTTSYQRQRIGMRLFQALIRRAHEERCTHVQLKCPSDLPANGFYAAAGCTYINTEEGKRRPLKIWHYPLGQDTAFISTDFHRAQQDTITPAQFFASLTVKPDEIEHLHRLWHERSHDFPWRYGAPNPFARVLISPIVAKPRTFAFVRALKENGETREVMFDSGGYFVQRGDITFYDLMHKLERLYRTENWADLYVLPDNPPLSSDDITVVDAKVKQTVDGSLRLLQELPTAIQEKAMPVVHGARIQHIEYCQRHYLDSAVRFRRLGFGSFPTSGSNNTINRLNAQALFLLRDLTQELEQHKVGLHTFGISTPPAIYLLSLVGVTSFDSNGWMRSGGFGLVFLPFMRGHLVTFNSRRHNALTNAEFQRWKQTVGHNCPFCDSFSELSRNRWHRVLHNLTVMAELETHQRMPRHDLLQALSVDYYRILRSLTRN